MQKIQLTVKEAATLWNIPEWTLRAYISKRRIPFRRVGRRIYIEVEKFNAWLKKGDVDPIPEGKGGGK